MGVSTDGILFWGFTFKGEDHDFDAPAWGNKEEGCRWSNWEYDAPKELKAKLKKLNIEIDYHCSGEYPEYFITLKETNFCANRGYPKEIKTLDVPKDGKERLQEACKLLDIPWQEPKWWLASLWN